MQPPRRSLRLPDLPRREPEPPHEQQHESFLELKFKIPCPTPALRSNLRRDMALAAERAKYGLAAEFKVTREMKKLFTPQEKVMYKCAYEVGGAGRANEVMRVYFAKKKAAAARTSAGEASNASGAADPKPPEPKAAAPTTAAAPPTTAAAPVELTVVPPGETLPAGQLLYAGTIDWYVSLCLEGCTRSFCLLLAVAYAKNKPWVGGMRDVFSRVQGQRREEDERSRILLVEFSSASRRRQSSYGGQRGQRVPQCMR